MSRAERLVGCLLGQALGDALGFVVEGQPRSICGPYVDRLRAGTLEGPAGRGGFAFGQYSDDTQLARELLQSFVACRGFDPADYGRRIGDIFASGRIVGRGAATEAAAARLAEGIDWRQAGTPPPAAGNGSAMRAGPVGLLAGDVDALIEMAVDQGRITHQDPRCQAGSVAIAGAVWLASRGEPVDPERLAIWAAPLDASVAAAIRALAEWRRLPPEQAVEPIGALGRSPRFPPWPGISPFVTSSVCWSLYCCLRWPESYWDAVCAAIAVGGDVDTTAAMTGAIAGAATPGDLPEALLAALDDRGTWRRDELATLAAAAAEIGVRRSEPQ